jgi:hypothetical protein
MKSGRVGPRRAVAPSYRNRQNPAELGRAEDSGHVWLAAAIKSGKKLKDFAIARAKSGVKARRAKSPAKK